MLCRARWCDILSRVLVDILGLASRLIIPGWIEDLLAERLALLGQDSYLAARYEQDQLEPLCGLAPNRCDGACFCSGG
ncbi:hypothetical protein BH20ACT22_BH20ACT22_23510 [soil metagenome]